MTPKIAAFLDRHRPPSPCLVVDLDVIEHNYRRLRDAMPSVRVYYAVKANPAAPVLERLAGLGCGFDVASPAEMEASLAAGAPAEALTYSNTIKKPRDIAAAHARGVPIFAFDSKPELAKLAAEAPGRRVLCRILVDDAGADWPLGDKFGCAPEMARDLMREAAALGLVPYGLCFHIGSQQNDPGQWDIAIGRAAMLFSDLRASGLELALINLGGGLPAPYREPVPDVAENAAAIDAALTRHFGNRMPAVAIEPGRAIAATAGVIRAEVVLVARKDYGAPVRWVYLDIGRFGGLAETEGEAVRYEFRTRHDGGATGPVIIAGPTCDGADVLYRGAGYALPLALEAGETVDILSAGAYTACYSSVGFNGFPPLAAYYI